MKSAFNRSILALAAILVIAGASQASAQQKALKKYESGTKDFWANPPPDWFLGAVVARDLIVVALMVLVVRSVLRPATDPVRTAGRDDDPDWPAPAPTIEPRADSRPVRRSTETWPSVSPV